MIEDEEQGIPSLVGADDKWIPLNRAILWAAYGDFDYQEQETMEEDTGTLIFYIERALADWACAKVYDLVKHEIIPLIAGHHIYIKGQSERPALVPDDCEDGHYAYKNNSLIKVSEIEFMFGLHAEFDELYSTEHHDLVDNFLLETLVEGGHNLSGFDYGLSPSLHDLLFFKESYAPNVTKFCDKANHLQDIAIRASDLHRHFDPSNNYPLLAFKRLAVEYQIYINNLKTNIRTPPPDFSFLDRGYTPKKTTSASTTGRPAKYEWDKLWQHMARLSSLGELPETKAEATTLAHDWCFKNFKECQRNPDCLLTKDDVRTKVVRYFYSPE